MDDVLIQLYCQQGHSPSWIATAIDQPISYVEKVIQEQGLIINDNLPAITSSDDRIQRLKDQEIEKQELFAPTYTRAEALLVQRIVETAEALDTSHPTAHESLKSLTSSLQSLKQNAVVNTMADGKGMNGGIAIQIINTIT